ncbi:MAG TPA: hydrogenase 4 subunit B, partial [Hyphomicrobiaceae bacterium]|nr:hydrogenase 4 subunit B [Hyphomicrobiaceae bacterium]
MPVIVALFAVTVLLIAAPLAVVLQRARRASPFTYAVCLAACLAIMSAAGLQLLEGAGTAPALQLPVGLPWIGAHFRMDALSAFFLLVTNLGGAGASLFAIGYGTHEKAPGRVLPFYPVFLGAMNLVLLADDAFSFLVAVVLGAGDGA